MQPLALEMTTVCLGGLAVSGLTRSFCVPWYTLIKVVFSYAKERRERSNYRSSFLSLIKTCSSMFLNILQGVVAMWKRTIGVVVMVSALSGCGYNAMQSQDEAANAAWSDVLNQYKRRADLIPSLVNTVKGYASHENNVFTQVTEARAKVNRMMIDENLINDEQKLKQFNAAQGQLSSALSRLMAVAENYPQLKADANFRDLQAQIEGTENRVATARNRYISAIQAYNTTVRSFPSNLTAMVFGMKPKANFSVEDEQTISMPPTVDFGQNNNSES